MRELIKRYHSQPFHNETRSIGDIIRYRAVMRLAAAGYALKFRRELARTRDYIGTLRQEIAREGKSAFVFANGPSLSDIDLGKVADLCRSDRYDLIAINSFFSKSASIARPRFAVFCDNVHFSGKDDQYSRDMQTCIDLNITRFVPAKYRRDDPNSFGYCNMCNIDSNNVSDVTRPAGYYGVTAFFAISLAKMLGYENIYLCGFDNSYFKDFEVDTEGGMHIHHRHYYDDRMMETKVPCLYDKTSNFFFDSYRHFDFLEKICRNDPRIFNIAKTSYVSSIPRFFGLDVYG